MFRFCLLFSSILACCVVSAQEIRCTLTPFRNADASNVRRADGTTEIKGATAIRIAIDSQLGDGDWVLALQYFCAGGTDRLTLASGSPKGRTNQRTLEPLGNSETFTQHAVGLSKPEVSALQRQHGLRLDVTLKPDAVLRFRDVKIRRPRTGEFEKTPESSVYAADTDALKTYLSHSYDNSITSVAAGLTEITITGNVNGSGDDVSVGDIPIETLVTNANPYRTLTPIDVRDDGKFTITVPRVISVDARSIDRLTSRWQLVRRSDSGNVAISHARYTDTVACRAPDLPPAVLRNKKGLGGWSVRRQPELTGELETLGISAVTVNVFALHRYVSTRPREGFTSFTWQGRQYYANEKELQRLDATFRRAAETGVMVSAILLVTNPGDRRDDDASMLAHPDADRSGKFAMPAVTSPDGVAYYGAILNLMAERWSHNDSVHGRVHHWIVHNEVDFGWIWNNAGRQTDIAYMDLYQRSMRMVHLIARQYDPHAKSWISLTHHWADGGTKYGFGSKRMLELLTEFCAAEGDFPWAVAYHPYPQSLFNPRTWEDKQATTGFDTAKITPRNLEVLDAYMKLPPMRYRGAVRPVHLSENGFNSKDYSSNSLEDQAAGMALAWKKMQNLSSIKSWQYHNWVDNRHEGGLRIGLRKFADDATDPLGKKPIWHLYRGLGTPQEDTLSAPYLKTIGIDSWDEISIEPTAK